MKDLREYIEGYQDIQKEIEISRKYGTDYASQRGKQAEIINRIHPAQLTLEVSAIIEETSSCKTLRLVSPNGYLPPFQAGQYINLFVEIDGVRTSRPYSISSSPRQRAYYDITVRRIETGFVSDYLLDNVRAGDQFISSGPAGNFYYNPLYHGKDLVLLAGGSGVTPFMSMIREAVDAGLDRNIHLIYGSRTEDDVLFYEELKTLAERSKRFTFDLVLSEPSSSFIGYKGLIGAELINQLVESTNAKFYYICGPQQMYEYCEAELQSMGIPARKIRREMFGTATDITKEAGWPADLDPDQEFSVIVKGKKTISAKAGEPLLIALERAGILVPVCCRSGECSLCRVKLLSGTVFQPRGVLIRESDRKYGYIHSCKAYPLENMEISL
ncbi:MAG: FAD-binding oxidoreductase [Bacillota bacterium]|nr:FAD-binding oxidoreductase [Bacillota bacterium]